MSKIKSYRGLMADGVQEKIALSTNNGMTGYRIVKLELFSANPGLVTQESVFKVFTIPQTTVTSTVDFSKPELIGAGYLSVNTSNIYPGFLSVTFDNTIFNQDIYITHVDNSTGEALNYHIELEQMSLDLNEQTVTTLKDIRNIGAE